jgi:hypothetical protein
MTNNRRLIAVDCETDPAKHGRVPKPFVWGVFDGTNYFYFFSTPDFVAWLSKQNVIAYAHNGGKFDFMFLIKYVGETNAQVINGRIVKMKLGRAELRDSIAIVPEALKKFGKKKDIDYWKMEADVRDEHMPEILEYLKYDCVSLYEVVSEYRKIAGKKTTIAGNALAFSKKLGIDMGRTNHTFDERMRPYFFGGRCEVFQPGTHKNIRVIDIHSAYPFAMCHDHPCGNIRQRLSYTAFNSLTREEKQRCFIRLTCKAKGCFPFRTKTGLEFPHMQGEFYITGWEYIAALELNLVSNVEFLEIISLPNTINFKAYVDHWYELKRNTDKNLDPIHYIIAKIMMNSLYGKSAQNIARYFDYKILPCGTALCEEPVPSKKDHTICKLCGEKLMDHGWRKSVEYEDIEVHRRAALWKYEFRFGKEWEGQPLYNNVATGASITGFTRAHLLRAIYTVGIKNVIYCDTDSIICKASADLSKLGMTDKLGDWGDEGTGSIGHFAGKKMYGIILDKICKTHNAPTGEKCKDCYQPEETHGKAHKVKIASKGSKLTLTDIEALMRGEKVVWKSEFPSFSVAGRPDFVVRNIRSTAKPVLACET